MRAYRTAFRQAASTLEFAFEPPSRNANVLQPEHPFAHALDLLRVLVRQTLATGIVLAIATVGATVSAGWARRLLVPAIIVELGVALGLVVVALVAFERAEDLIAEGHGTLPLPLLERQRKRLLDRRRRDALAEAFDDVVDTAARWQTVLHGYRPVYNIHVVRHVVPDLLEIAAMLRADTADASGVALAKRLLTSGSSPLYGTDINELRAGLWRIRGALGADHSPAEPPSTT